MENEPKKPRIHHCFNCGEEMEDYDELPNGRKLYVCGSSACGKEFIQACRECESEVRDDAEQDGYSRYY